MKLLWLPGWYPNKTALYTGDFVQRHARAVSLYHAVQVIYVVRDKDGIITKDIKEENFRHGQLEEKIIYYHTPVFSNPFIDKFISTRRYGLLCRKYTKAYINKEGIPSCTHIQIADKNMLVALWLKRKYNIPFVISEQWTAFLPEAKPGFASFHWLFRALWKKTAKAAKGFSVVSNYLGDAIKKLQKSVHFAVIPNVVDNNIFFPIEKKEITPVHFIHISTLGYQKNPEAILQAFALVKKTHPAFRLSVFGPQKNDLEELVMDLGLQENVFFHHEVPQQQLAVFLQQSHALILYSRYETFGCVLIEANACGIPVIVSDIPVFHETISEGINGYFVQGENPGLLAQKIIWFMQQDREMPDKKAIVETTEKYNYSLVGKLFSEFYKTVLEN